MHCFDSISTNWMKLFEKTKIFYWNKFKYSKMRIVFNCIMLTISTFIYKIIYMHLSFIKTGSLSWSNSDFMFWCALCGFFWPDTMPLLKCALNWAYKIKFNEKMQSNTSIFFQNKVLISANIKLNYHFLSWKTKFLWSVSTKTWISFWMKLYLMICHCHRHFHCFLIFQFQLIQDYW